MAREPDIPFEHFQVFTFGSDEELTAVFGSLEAAEAAWQSVRDEFLRRWDLWGMPEAWWRFEPDIPEHLRSGPPLVLSESDADRWRVLEAARRRYLASLGIDPQAPRHHTPFGHV